jgi:hypothetical protein
MTKQEALRKARAARKPQHPARIHLFRGVPAVRSWSKHQRTVEDWTLCGIRRGMGREGGFVNENSVEDASLVSCPHCVELMHPTQCTLARVPCSFCALRKHARRSAAA